MSTVLLLTDRPGFESRWSAACLERGLPLARPTTEVHEALRQASVLVFDGDCDRFVGGKLLAAVGLARAHGALTAVGFDQPAASPTSHDLLLELCKGLVAYRQDDVERVASGLLRRSTATREPRFVHLELGANRSELLALLSDASAYVLERPLSAADQGGELLDVRLTREGAAAELNQGDGSSFELRAAEVVQSKLRGSHADGPSASALGDVDGVRLGQRLRALRLAAGLTQAELARRTGIHRPNIARVEAGRHTPSLETLARLAAAIGISTTRVLAD